MQRIVRSMLRPAPTRFSRPTRADGCECRGASGSRSSKWVPMIKVGHHPRVVLPNRGDVYKVLGAIQDPVDKKYNRRAVVVAVPADINGRIVIITRTTNLLRRGVPSPVDHSLRLDVEGVWGYYRTVEARLWVPPDVQRIGTMDTPTVDVICKKFRIRGAKP
jgi:hypothetical protein